MKKITIILLLLLSLAVLSSFSQQGRVHNKEEYKEVLGVFFDCTIDTVISHHKVDAVTDTFMVIVEYVDRGVPCVARISAYARHTKYTPMVLLIMEDPVNEEVYMKKLLDIAEIRGVKLYGVSKQFQIRELN